MPSVICMVLILSAGLAIAEPPKPHRVGFYTVTFDERSPRSDIAAQIKRCRWNPTKPLADYDLAEETFNVFVPQSYEDALTKRVNKTSLEAGKDQSAAERPLREGARPFGILVWIDARPTAGLPNDWRKPLSDHRLIWVGANKAGNPRDIWQRLGLALDAAHNIAKLYHTDAERIYISGLSGGGRSASRMGIYYPRLFRGAMPIVGCDFYLPIPVPGKPGHAYPPRFRPPATPLLQYAKYQNRFVLMTGEKDYNRDSTKAIFRQGYQRQRFRYVTYLEVPGMGHTLPDGEWFGRGIAALDQPLMEKRRKLESRQR